jgi:hypothetical protein
MAISRMQQPRQMYNQGMMVHDPRQAYGLGGFIKKAVRGVKKIAKSPIGKMALLGGGMYLAGGGGMPGFLGGKGLGGFGGNKFGAFLKGGLGNFKSGTKGTMMGGFSDIFRKGGETGADFSMGRLLAGGLGATALAMPFLGGKDEEEESGEVMDPAYQTQRARDFYSGQGTKGVGLDFMPQKKYVNQNFYAADGGRAGYANGMLVDDEEDEIAFARSGAGQSRRQQQTFLNMGGGAGNAQAEQMLMAEFVKYKNKGGDLSFEQFVQAVMQQQGQSQGMEQPTMMAADGGMAGMSVPGYGTPAGTNQFGYPSGGERVNAAEGGIMDTEQAEMIDMGGNEKDYRETGGFVEMGGEERADDVPARLSKNEFVFTADAVRNAGGGDIDRGSEVMQNLMDNLEQGGQVSEDSQGLGGGEEMMSEEIIEEPNGAQAMYEQQQALQSRMA